MYRFGRTGGFRPSGRVRPALQSGHILQNRTFTLVRRCDEAYDSRSRFNIFAGAACRLCAKCWEQRSCPFEKGLGLNVSRAVQKWLTRAADTMRPRGPLAIVTTARALHWLLAGLLIWFVLYIAIVLPFF